MPTFRFLALVMVPLALGCSHVAADAERNYFSALNIELKAKGIGRPVIILDLDRLDHNLAVVKSHLTAPLHFRAVEKSLPSVELLNYILEKMGSHRVMAFHHPFLRTLLTELPADTDILFGKTILIAGVAEVFAQLDEAQRAQATSRVQWLIDSPQTLNEYLAFFKQRGGTFNANVELDVGLHRGGAEDEAELEEILALLKANRDTVTLTGLMGYDGHVAHVPVPEFMLRWAMGVTLNGVQRTYQKLWDYLRATHPELAATVRTLNGGGSSTYSLYRPDSVISDISLGSALVKPSEYDVLALEEHQPALYIATPILKKMHPAKLPFLGALTFSDDVDGYYIYGGGWAPEFEYPRGVQHHALMSSAPNHCLVSNQSFVYGTAVPRVEIGDFMFYRPPEADAVFLFDEIHLLRGGKLVGSFRPFANRY